MNDCFRILIPTRPNSQETVCRLKEKGERQMRVLATMIVLLMASLPAYADLIGSQLSWDYYAYGGLGWNGSTWTVPGSGGNFSDELFTYFNVSADDTSITFNYSVDTFGGMPWANSALSLSPTIYNGIAIDLVSGSSFTSVSIDSATNMAGFDASHVSFTGNQIQVDWHGLPFDTSTIVKLDVGTSTVPEPASLLLLGTGLAGIALAAWRNNK
jgi:hypothetical protein